MSDDLVKRLRNWEHDFPPRYLMEDAANRIEALEAALWEIEYLDRPQVRGLPRRIEIGDIARAALAGEKKDE